MRKTPLAAVSEGKQMHRESVATTVFRKAKNEEWHWAESGKRWARSAHIITHN